LSRKLKELAGFMKWLEKNWQVYRRLFNRFLDFLRTTVTYQYQIFLVLLRKMVIYLWEPPDTGLYSCLYLTAKKLCKNTCASITSYLFVANSLVFHLANLSWDNLVCTNMNNSKDI
jgi:hypothetical protein